MLFGCGPSLSTVERLGPEVEARPAGCEVATHLTSPPAYAVSDIAHVQERCTWRHGENRTGAQARCLARVRAAACELGADTIHDVRARRSLSEWVITATVAVERGATAASADFAACEPVCSPGFRCDRGQCAPACDPGCDAGYACIEGECQAECNPTCANGFSCGPDRTCQVTAEREDEAPPADEPGEASAQGDEARNDAPGATEERTEASAEAASAEPPTAAPTSS